MMTNDDYDDDYNQDDQDDDTITNIGRNFQNR
jgi:hypothetical protein